MSPRSILLTGFPRNELARLVLSRLLDTLPDVRITCVIPERFAALSAEWLNALPKAKGSRVQTLEGEITALDLGLSGVEFNELTAHVDTIHHCSAITYTGAPYAQAEAVNVSGTCEVVELARAARHLERFVHWSTLYATGAHDDGVVYEDGLVEPEASRLTRTRHRAERILHDARADLPVTIIRPAMLVGDSRTGQLSRVEGAHLLIAGLLSAPRDLPLPRFTRGDMPLQVVPIDYAVEAGLIIARDAETTGRNYHVLDPSPISLDYALELIGELIGRPPPRGSVPSAFAQMLAQMPLMERVAHAQVALVEELSRQVRYDDRNARPILARAGASCPALSSYVGKLVSHVDRERKSERISAIPSNDG